MIEQFQIKLSRKMEWQQVNKMWIGIWEDTLDKQKMHNKDWISPKTIEKLHARKESSLNVHVTFHLSSKQKPDTGRKVKDAGAVLKSSQRD